MTKVNADFRHAVLVSISTLLDLTARHDRQASASHPTEIDDNAATALAKADMYVGQCYSELCTSEDQRRRIWMLIASERDRSRQAILDIVGGSELLATTPWFRSSIEVRNPDIDPLNLIQIELLQRRRRLDGSVDQPELQRLRDLLRLSVQGVAAGMRTTG